MPMAACECYIILHMTRSSPDGKSLISKNQLSFTNPNPNPKNMQEKKYVESFFKRKMSTTL